MLWQKLICHSRIGIKMQRYKSDRMEQYMLKIAVVGLGTIAPIHLFAISKCENAQIVCVCDIDENKKPQDLDVPFYTDMKEIVKNHEIDCVHICLPHYLHDEAIEFFAKNGINVFTEKPITLNYKRAQKLFSLEKEHNVKIGVCLQNRYNNTTIMLKDLVNKAEYGKVLGAKALITWQRTQQYYDEAPWRGTWHEAGGGCMINQSIHSLDLLEYIVGKATAVNAVVGNISLPKVEIEDTVVANLKYENGANGIFFATNAYCTSSNVEIEIICEKAMLKMRDNKCYLTEEGKEETMICEDVKLAGSKHYYGASHYIAISEFYKALNDNSSDYISLTQAARSLHVIDMIQKSSAEKKEMELF